MKLRKMLCRTLTLMLLAPAAGNAELDLTTPAPTPAPAAPPALSAAPLLETPPIGLPCAAAILVEPQSGQVIFEQNADTPRPVASVTKVMTILLALEHGEPLDEAVYCAVMFDKTISGEVPEHRDFIYHTAIPKLERMGVEVVSCARRRPM